MQTSVTTTEQQPIPPAKADKTLRITGKNKAAIDAMVWEGLNRKDAAQKAGLKDHALYVALTKPHVKQYYLAQLDVLRTSERARNIHTLAEVRDQTGNAMARVQAVKALEQMDDAQVAGRSAQSVPGLVIQIINNSPSPRTIDALVTQPQAIEHET